MPAPRCPLQNPSLVRGLGPVAATAIVVAGVIGTGVFLKARVMTCNVEHAVAGDGGVDRRRPAGDGRRADLRRAERDDAARRRRVRLHPRGVRPDGRLPVRVDAVLHRQHRRHGGPGVRAWHLPERGDRRRAERDAGRRATSADGRGISLDGIKVVAIAAILLATLINCAAVSVGGTDGVGADGAEGRLRPRYRHRRRWCLATATGRT